MDKRVSLIEALVVEDEDVDALAAEAMREAVENPLPGEVEETDDVRDVLEAAILLKTTDDMVAQPRFAPDRLTLARAAADAAVYGADAARFKLAASASAAKEREFEIGWYSYGALDLAWIAVAMMRANSPATHEFWFAADSESNGLTMNDFGEFFGRFVRSAPAFRMPFSSMTADDVVFGLSVACTVWTEYSEVKRTPRWFPYANFVVRALLTRAQAVVAFEQPPEVVGITYALHMPGNSRIAMQRGGGGGKKEDALMAELEDGREARRFFEDLLDGQDGGGGDAKDSVAQARTEAHKKIREAARKRQADVESTWLRSDSEGEDEDDDDDEPRAPPPAASVGEGAPTIRGRTASVSIKFVREVRLLSSYLLRECAESAALVVEPHVSNRLERCALIRLRSWMMSELQWVNKEEIRVRFKAFAADHVCTAADFAVDRMRFPTLPAKTKSEVLGRRGLTIGEEGDGGEPVLPNETDHLGFALKHRRLWTDFMLHYVTSQYGSSAFDLLTQKCRSTPWYTRPCEPNSPILFWDGGRGAWVCVDRDDWVGLRAYKSVTHYVVHARRTGSLKKKMQLRDSSGRALAATCDLSVLDSRILSDVVAAGGAGEEEDASDSD